MHKLQLVRALLIILIIDLPVRCQPIDSPNLSFQLVPEKLTFAPGSNMQVKFIITNAGHDPVYLFRTSSECTSQIGSYTLVILDHNKRQVNASGCSSDLVMDQLNVLETLTTSGTGILLKHGEIYGAASEFELPKKKGTYRLIAKMIPPSFTDRQKVALLQNKMKTLDETIVAPVVTITIK